MSNSDRIVWLITYDIADPKRLRQIYRIMRGFGDHLQLSVFRCLLSARQMAELKGRLNEVIAPAKDQVLFVRVGRPNRSNDAAAFSLGLPLPRTQQICIVV